MDNVIDLSLKIAEGLAADGLELLIMESQGIAPRPELIAKGKARILSINTKISQKIILEHPAGEA